VHRKRLGNLFTYNIGLIVKIPPKAFRKRLLMALFVERHSKLYTQIKRKGGLHGWQVQATTH